MGSLGFWQQALADPGRIAAIEPDGTAHAAGDLLARVNQLSPRPAGLGPAGAATASPRWLPNGVAPLEVYLAALQAGWYFTPINWHFTAPEIAYIVRDSEAKAFFVHERFGRPGPGRGRRGRAAGQRAVQLRARCPGFSPVEELRPGQPTPTRRTAPPAPPCTTPRAPPGGRRACARPLTGLDPDDMAASCRRPAAASSASPTARRNVHLVDLAELPHRGDHVRRRCALHMGHTLVYMDGWDAEQALELVERYQVTNTHMVPTQFKRMLALPEETRQRYDLSSHALAAARAPRPARSGIKQAMLEWWGPVRVRVLRGHRGRRHIATPQDWLARPGTVGRPWPGSEIMIVDDDGQQCPPGVAGTVYMRMGAGRFAYKGDPAKTEANRLRGLLHRRRHRLPRRGRLPVPVRPQERHDHLRRGEHLPGRDRGRAIMHPKVADVAVFGIPDDEWGEQVKAVVEPARGVGPGRELAAEILASLEGRLARMKWPKSDRLHRRDAARPSGKLLKRRLREPYWRARAARSTPGSPLRDARSRPGAVAR